MSDVISGFFNNLPMDDLIGGPLVAAATANDNMANAQYELMMRHCFSKQDDKYVPVMVNLTIGRSRIVEGKLEQNQATIEIPLLTLMPLSHLSVQDLDIAFSMEVNHSESIDQKENATRKVPKLFGRVRNTTSTHKQTNTSSAASYDVKLKAKSIPLPLGVTTLLDALSKQIQPIEIDQ